MTKIEFIKMVSDNHKSGKWLSGYFDVDGVNIGVKSYGKWVQRLEGNGLPYWSGSECKTVGAFNLAIETGLNYILKG